MNSHHLESGRALTSLLFLIMILAVALGGVAFIFGTVVPIGYVGVRKVAFGPGQGLGTRPLDPGFHWTIPGYSTIYQVPQSIKILDFDRDTRTNQNSFGSLDIPTVDGTTVDIDAAVQCQSDRSSPRAEPPPSEGGARYCPALQLHHPERSAGCENARRTRLFPCAASRYHTH